MRWRRYVPTVMDNLIWLILVGVFLFFVIGSDKFLTPINIVNILSAAAVLGVVVVGQTFVLITGNFDLSQESTLGLAALLGLWIMVLILRGLMLAFTEGNAVNAFDFEGGDVFYWLGHETFAVPWLGNVPIA